MFIFLNSFKNKMKTTHYFKTKESHKTKNHKIIKVSSKKNMFLKFTKNIKSPN